MTSPPPAGETTTVDAAPQGGAELGASRRRRWGRIALIALAILVLLVVALRALLPFAIERGVPWLAAREAGLPVRLANVDFALLRGEVTLEGLVVGRPADLGLAEGPSPELALLRWQRLFAALDWRALLDGRVHLREIAFDEPVVRIQREADGRIDPLAGTPLMEPAAPEPESAEEAPAEPWPVILDRLGLRKVEVRLVDADGSTPVELSFEELDLNELGLEGSDIDLGGMALRGPRLKLRRDFTLPQGEGQGEGEAGAASGEPAPPPAHRLRRVAIENATFTLLTESRPLDIVIDLEAEDASMQTGHVFPVRLGLGVEGGKVEIEGRVGADPVSFEGRVAWSDLPLPPLSLISEPELGKWVRSCSAHGDLQVSLHLAAVRGAQGAKGGPAPGVRLVGSTSTRDLAIEDPAAAEVGVAWKSLDAEVEEIFLPIGDPSATTRVHLGKVRLTEPTIHYTRPTKAFDVFSAPAAGEQAEAAAASQAEDAVVDTGSEAGPLGVRIASFELSGGQLAFDDRSVSPAFRSEVRRLRVALRNVRWPDVAVGTFDVAAQLSQEGRVTAKGSLSALDEGEIQLVLQRLALPPLNPYVSPAAGYRVDRGEASLTTALRLRGNRYEADNQLVLHRLAVDPDSEADFQGQFGMSIDLALALLRDRKGDIGLPIPVALEGEAVQVGVGTIVRSAVSSAVKGALLSPLKALGAAIPSGGGGDGELRVEPLAAQPGRPDLVPGQDERLAQLAETLASRQALGVVLRGRAGKADRPALAEALLLERAIAGEPLPALESAGWSDRRRMSGLLEDREGGEEIEMDAEDSALWVRYVEVTEVPPERFDALAKRRAELAAEALRGDAGLDPVQIRIETADSRGSPGVLLELAPLELEEPGAQDSAE